MATEIWIALAATNFAASLAPGQNVALVSAVTMRSGFAGGIASLVGVLFAELVWAALALVFALGLLEMNPSLFHILQLCSGIALAYFGLAILREMNISYSENGAGYCFVRCVTKGAWIGFANPLALVFFIALFPGFLLQISDKPDTTIMATCILVILVSSAGGLIPWLVAAGLLSANKRVAGFVNFASGAALLTMGLVVFARFFLGEQPVI